MRNAFHYRPTPNEGAPGSRLLRQGRYNRATGHSGTRWLIHHSSRYNGTITDSRGQEYYQAPDGSIRRQA